MNNRNTINKTQDNKQVDMVSKIRAALCQAEQNLAAWLNRKTQSWNKRKKKIFLLVFLLLCGSGYTLILYQTIRYENKSQQLPVNNHIRAMPLYEQKDTSKRHFKPP